MAKLKRLQSRLKVESGNRLTVSNGSWRDHKQSSAKRGYGYKWQKTRELFLKENPLCVYCERNGIITSANVVDHIEPHRGDQALFWDRNNWQSLCSSCHSSIKQKEENKG
ncbi:HNH endonuclease [Wohlfahrtiimonas chitiniclastica]|uniref:HNH endonuclease n=1 Tax=Wohlfahrtiimonas chitiniclastica TaxID=400946 RepID=UPI001BD1BC17|nr:HNH endonuclease signature motif containing protein [Wohlfahrtiimonas chitiniclastica]MBS7837378.1 HNH endonuclease [Wohlfahrtiimonas chitiniclastica]